MAWPLAIFERTGTKIEEKREKKKMCLQRPPPTTHVAPLGQPH